LFRNCKFRHRSAARHGYFAFTNSARTVGVWSAADEAPPPHQPRTIADVRTEISAPAPLPAARVETATLEAIKRARKQDN
jgi:hypothetical protein